MSDRAPETERSHQAKILFELASRLQRGEPSLPTDVFRAVEEELELRVDDDAIAEAWSMQDEGEAAPWSEVKPRVL